MGWLNRLRRLVRAAAWTGNLAWLLFGFVAGLPVTAQNMENAKTSVTCATCHAAVAASYAHAPMRHAMESPGANPALGTHPKLSVELGGYTYTVMTKDGQSTYSVADGTGSLTVPIRWMIGEQSQTWVLERDGRLYESLVSFFPRDQVLAITPGDQKIVPHSLTEAMGRELSIWDARQCFNCHATHATEGVRLTLDKLRPGLDCERCHDGAQQHMADAARSNFSTLPKSLNRMDAEETSNFCGQCHRSWDTVVRNHWRGPAFVRFQPYRLSNSKCFQVNDRRISCLACHDPHQPANHNESYYDAKCLACHGDAKPTKADTAVKSCPVSKTDCVSCHMPKIEQPGKHASFTDHEIRIVKAGEAYPD